MNEEVNACVRVDLDWGKQHPKIGRGRKPLTLNFTAKLPLAEALIHRLDRFQNIAFSGLLADQRDPCPNQ